MQLFGREIKFMRTVASNCEIADMCPDGDINKAGTLFEGSYQRSQNTAAKFICIMNKGYEMNRHFSEPDYEPKPLTADEVLYLPDDVFNALFTEALEAYSGEKATIETAESGKKKAVKKSA